jgi:demethylmenaquinone methyltransferase / 2-methoxy-6-polyprenyl-1,4-benzoquinol methylase
VTKTHFGFTQVDESEKAGRVGAVFTSVADRYDLMNDLMSAGLHRLWKRFTVELARLKEGERVLDLASGSGDLALAFSQRTQNVVMTDINAAMLARGRDRMVDRGHPIPAVQCDAETLPFADQSFDLVTVAFGLRNMTHKEKALAEMYRVLAPGGRAIVLEFSQIWEPLKPAYDAYSLHVLPRMGQWVAGDADSYRYLAESIRMHPDQDTLKNMMQEAGFLGVKFHNLSAGIVALHMGYRY